MDSCHQQNPRCVSCRPKLDHPDDEQQQKHSKPKEEEEEEDAYANRTHRVIAAVLLHFSFCMWLGGLGLCDDSRRKPRLQCSVAFGAPLAVSPSP
eukprot:1015416-Prymnesium_polylepis.2